MVLTRFLSVRILSHHVPRTTTTTTLLLICVTMISRALMMSQCSVSVIVIKMLSLTVVTQCFEGRSWSIESLKNILSTADFNLASALPPAPVWSGESCKLGLLDCRKVGEKVMRRNQRYSDDGGAPGQAPLAPFVLVLELQDQLDPTLD